MTESWVHMALVKLVCQYVRDEYLDGDAGSIFCDAVGLFASDKPPHIAGYVPDVYAWVKHSGTTVVGEAKTERDLENKHTVAQFEAFIRHCLAMPNAAFLIAVPWQCTPLARNMLRRISQRAGVDVSICRVLHGIGLE